MDLDQKRGAPALEPDNQNSGITKRSSQFSRTEILYGLHNTLDVNLTRFPAVLPPLILEIPAQGL